MSFQSMVMSRPALASLFMSRASDAVFENGGKRTAMRAVDLAVNRTRAYREVLGEAGISVAEALLPDNFRSLPLLDKRTYTERFPLAQRVLDGSLLNGSIIERSSGYSGAAYYWPRTAEEEQRSPLFIEFAFRQFFQIQSKPTLMVIALALGTWSAGMKVAGVARQIAASGKYHFTVATPGIELDEILGIMRDIAPSFEQTVIVGYPPFAKVLVDEGIRRGIDFKPLHVRMLVGGEGFTEDWRAHMGEKLGWDTTRDLTAIIGGFGTSETGSMAGTEYPVSVLIRQLAHVDATLCRGLFGSLEPPDLFQYSPSGCFMEAVDGQLYFTLPAAVPLVRYSLGDLGGVVPYKRMMDVLGDHGYDVESRLRELGYDRSELWHLPFFYCHGRADGAVFVGGVNVYPENVGAALDKLDDPCLLGYKLATVKSEDRLTERLLVLIEHKDADLAEDERRALARKLVPVIRDGIAEVNSEYHRLSDVAPELVDPVVRVYPSGGGPFLEDVGKIKRKYVM